MVNTMLTTTGHDPAVDAVLQAFLLIYGIVFLILFVVLIIGTILSCIMLKKADKPWWAALVPIYGNWELSKVAFGDKYGWVGLVMIGLNFIPYIGQILAIAISVYYTFYLFKSYGLSSGLCIAGIFIPIVPMCYIAFSSNVTYQGPVPSKIHEMFP